MPKQNRSESTNSAAPYLRFIFTITLHPKRVSTYPTVTGRSAGYVVEVPSSGSFLWKEYNKAEAM